MVQVFLEQVFRLYSGICRCVLDLQQKYNDTRRKPKKVDAKSISKFVEFLQWSETKHILTKHYN